MSRFTVVFFIFAAVFSLLSCSNFKDDSVMYVFKGDVVSVSDFKLKYSLWLRQNNMTDSGEMRKNYLFRELSEKFLYEMGKSEGVGDIPEIKNKIEDFKRKTIVEYMNKRTKREVYAIDDEAVRQYYIENKDMFLRDKLYRLYAVRVTNRKTYYEMTDGTWMCDGYLYKYQLEINGRMPNAAVNSFFVYLSNIEEITFDQAYKAAGISSNSDDYFSPKKAILVEMN